MIRRRNQRKTRLVCHLLFETGALMVVPQPDDWPVEQFVQAVNKIADQAAGHSWFGELPPVIEWETVRV